MMRFTFPFVIFIVIAVFLFIGLNLNPREVPSPLVGKPAPAFVLPQLQNTSKQFSPQDMKGKVWMLNVWASWCATCAAEHPLLMALAQQKIVPIVGLVYKDTREAALNILLRRGDPYILAVSDTDGRIAIDYGVYAVPETYVIDKQGVIQYKQIGAITEENLREKILPLIAELEKK